MELKTLTLSEVLMSLDGGGSVEDIQDKVREVTQAVLGSGNTGSVTIKLQFSRNGKDGSRQVAVKDSVSCVMPKIDKPVSLFFATDDGNLTRQNPDQMRFAIAEEAK